MDDKLKNKISRTRGPRLYVPVSVELRDDLRVIAEKKSTTMSSLILEKIYEIQAENKEILVLRGLSDVKSEISNTGNLELEKNNVSLHMQESGAELDEFRQSHKFGTNSQPQPQINMIGHEVNKAKNLIDGVREFWKRKDEI